MDNKNRKINFTKSSYLLLLFLFSLAAIYFILSSSVQTGAPPYYAENPPDRIPYIFKKFPELKNWQRPQGPPKIGIQVGHFKNEELPDELKKLREKGGGSQGGGKKEWEVNLEIARHTAKLLEEEGYVVDIIPAKVPRYYWADVFVAIHADGSNNPYVSGFKIASPWRDYTGRADSLAEILGSEYQKETNLAVDPNITSNMRGYYAFSWWRFDHAIHPATTAVILETGFLTSYKDQKMLIYNPEIPARGIANGIIKYLNSLKNNTQSS